MILHIENDQGVDKEQYETASEATPSPLECPTNEASEASQPPLESPINEASEAPLECPTNAASKDEEELSRASLISDRGEEMFNEAPHLICGSIWADSEKAITDLRYDDNSARIETVPYGCFVPVSVNSFDENLPYIIVTQERRGRRASIQEKITRMKSALSGLYSSSQTSVYDITSPSRYRSPSPPSFCDCCELSCLSSEKKKDTVIIV